MTRQLKRESGIFGATMMGLGLIIGTGIFVNEALVWQMIAQRTLKQV